MKDRMTEETLYSLQTFKFIFLTKAGDLIADFPPTSKSHDVTLQRSRSRRPAGCFQKSYHITRITDSDLTHRLLQNMRVLSNSQLDSVIYNLLIPLSCLPESCQGVFNTLRHLCAYPGSGCAGGTTLGFRRATG